MSMAIKYAMKKRAKKMAKGGESTETSASNRQNQKGVHQSITRGDAGTSVAGGYIPKHGYGANVETAKRLHREKLAEMQSMKKPNLYADGGFIEEEDASGFVDHEGNDVKHDGAAIAEDDRDLNQHGAEDHGPMGVAHAFGDMVDRVMRKRYSKGGMIANGGDDDLDQMADGDPNNFDDLALRDHLESSYTGKNSGDELGDEQEDEDRHDMVARIMKSRAKKDRMPRPA
jgi:hypothetical protein